MFDINETCSKIQQSIEERERLVEEGKNILQHQSKTMCQALQQLLRRRDSGQEAAQKVWDSLIDGISKVPDLFDDNITDQFWKPEDGIPGDELAFQTLLKQAARKYQEQRKTNKANDNGLLGEDSGTEPQRSSTGGEKSVDAKSTPSPDQLLPEDINELEKQRLLDCLMEMIRVAAEKTDMSNWVWSRLEESFKLEMEHFNKTLRLALELFEKLHRKSDLEQLAEIVESLSQYGTGDTSSVSSASTDDDDEFAWSGSDIDDGDGDTIKSNESSGESKLDAAYADGSSSDEPPPLPTKGPKIRLRRKLVVGSRMSGDEKPAPLRNDPCLHAGCPLPQSHYRDWKRDGFRCICGQKFPSLNAMERHIHNIVDGRTLKCQFCDYTINRKCCLEKHCKNVHDDDNLKGKSRMYQCKFGCGRFFPSKYTVAKHQRDTGGRQCIFINAQKVPKKTLPASPSKFVDLARVTLKAAKKQLTPDALCSIILAVEKDEERIQQQMAQIFLK